MVSAGFLQPAVFTQIDIMMLLIGGIIMVKAIVGANWGDEGKGKITDMMAADADIIVRFQEAQMQDIQS